MNRFSLIIRQKLISVIMLAVSILGGIFIYLYLGHLKAGQNIVFEGQEIIIASQDILKGSIITASDIADQNIPESIFSDKYIFEKESVIGKAASEDILQGEILTREKISGFKEISEDLKSISSYIPQYLKAVSVPVVFYGDISLLSNGDLVDVISVYYEKSKDELISETILDSEELMIIDPGHSTGNMETEGNALFDNMDQHSMFAYQGHVNQIIATFFLDSTEAERIFLALERGVLNIAICSKNIYGKM